MVSTKKKIQKKSQIRDKKLRRNRVSFVLNDDEKAVMDNYLSRYKILNKSNWLRMTMLSFVYKNMEEDYPTLFKENDMRR